MYMYKRSMYMKYPERRNLHSLEMVIYAKTITFFLQKFDPQD